jgi:hypothetical protein
MVIFLSVMVIFPCVVCIVAASPRARHQKVTVLLLLNGYSQIRRNTLRNDSGGSLGVRRAANERSRSRRPACISWDFCKDHPNTNSEDEEHYPGG